jgi:uncharacterized protein (DUF433 family)
MGSLDSGCGDERPCNTSGRQHVPRVPVQTLFEYIEDGAPLDDFLKGFPSVTREHAVAVLELGK